MPCYRRWSPWRPPQSCWRRRLEGRGLDKSLSRDARCFGEFISRRAGRCFTWGVADPLLAQTGPESGSSLTPVRHACFAMPSPRDASGHVGERGAVKHSTCACTRQGRRPRCLQPWTVSSFEDPVGGLLCTIMRRGTAKRGAARSHQSADAHRHRRTRFVGTWTDADTESSLPATRIGPVRIQGTFS